MKFLYTITSYPPSTGGAQLYTHLLANSLSAKHKIGVATLWDHNRTDWLLGATLRLPTQASTYSYDNIPVLRMGMTTRQKVSLLPAILAYYPLMQWAIHPIAQAYLPQLQPIAAQTNLIHNVRVGREPLSYASFKVARQKNIPFVFTPLHHPRWVGWRYRAYIRLYTEADLVIALTQVEKQILITLGVREEKISVTGMGPVLAKSADPEQFLHDHHIDGPFILYLGQHYAYKGYKQVLEAAQQVWEKIPEAHFVFIGPAVGNSEKDFAHFTDRRLHRLGKVDLQTKTNALAACALLCVPSTQESFGGVYSEAWSFAKPVIGCNIPAVAEVISEGVDGFLVEQEMIQIAERICHLLLNPAQAQSIGQAGKQKVDEQYTWPKLAELTEQAYYKVLAG